MNNYLKNPVILAFHDHSDPVGRMVEHKIDSGGLWIKARISPSAEHVFEKVKDGIITAFSVAFRVLDAEYNTVAELFIIKKLELLEISVVSVPMNQDCLFDLSKSFDSASEFEEFKMQFAVKDSSSAKEPKDSMTASGGYSKRGKNMDNGTQPNVEQLVADAAAKAAEAATAKFLERQELKAKAAEAAAAEEAALLSKIEKAVESKISTGQSGAEKLLDEVTKRLTQAEEASAKSIADLKAALDEKAAELAAIQKSKMTFKDGGKEEAVTAEEKSSAVLLSKILKKDINDTKFGASLREKVGQHLPSATWELEVSLSMENEIRRRLVVEPIFRKVQMKTNVMTFPLNPETGHANWVTNAQFADDDR
jgi:HK97 family phage prohead protease